MHYNELILKKEELIKIYKQITRKFTKIAILIYNTQSNSTPGGKIIILCPDHANLKLGFRELAYKN